MIDTTTLLWISVIVLISYAPVLCYLDLAFRDVFTHWIWLPAILIESIFSVGLFRAGLYDQITIGMSLVAILFWFAAMRLGVINGGDFVYLVLIFSFAVYSPISGHMMYLPLMFFLAIWTFLSLAFFLAKKLKDQIITNALQGKPIAPNFGMALYETLHPENGFPMMIPISLSLITSVILA